MQQLRHKGSVKWVLNATKYLFCCVRRSGAIGRGCFWVIGNVVLRLAIYDGAGLGLLGAINGGRRGRWVGPGWGFV